MAMDLTKGSTNFLVDPVSDDMRSVLEFSLSVVIGVQSSFGIVFQVLNIIVFINLGHKDGVTLTFLALSLADVGQLLIPLLTCAFTWVNFALREMERDSFVDFISLVYISIWYDHMFCDISVAVTTYMAVQRCCCVAMPLHFRSVFTDKRTAQALACISGAVVVTYLPVFATQGLQVVSSNATTASRKLVLWLSPRRPAVQGVNDVINKIVLRSAAQIVVAVCLVVLAVQLVAASRFRRKLRSSRQDGTKQQESSSPAGISRHDLQVIKSVTLVSVMFVLSNCPRLMFTYARRIEPEFNVLRAYENLYYVLSQVCNLAECMNASLTICVYATHNARFAAVLRRCLCCHSDSVDE